MKHRNLRRRAASAVLALTLLLGTIPAAFATTDGKCACNSTYDLRVLKQANCHEEGVVEYICTNPNCTAGNYNKSQLVKTAKDPSNHDAAYKDNGDGSTHTATCRYHTEYKNVTEPHNFVGGYCTKCAAADYSQAVITLNPTPDIYVSLADTQAEISIGEVKVTVGGMDVTENYTLSYSWLDQSGTTVGSTASYTLPATVTTKEADLTYGCLVMAMPKAGTAGKFISESCTVSVHVRDLILSTATVNTDDNTFLLGSTNNRTPLSVAEQIYKAAYKLSTANPSYVIFGTKPTSTAGVLNVNNHAYYFSPSGSQQDLSTVVFDPSDTTAGSYVINYTVYDTVGKAFPGVLTVIVEKDLGDLGISYVTAKNEPVKLSAADFSLFWQETYPTGSLNLIYFNSLPTIREGVLYYNYNASSLINTPANTLDTYYVAPVNLNYKLIDGLTFVPDIKFTGLVTIPFEMYGTNNRNQQTFLEGNLSIFVSSGTVQDVSYTVNSGSALSLSATDFLLVHQLATGSASTDFSIKLLDVPQKGNLYVDYTGTALDRPLNILTISDYTFYYSSALSKEISDLTYICPKSTTTTTDTIRYVACNSKGEFEYVGEITITAKASIVVYTKYFPDVIKTASTEWYYTAVMDLAEANVIGGYDDGTFKPDEKVTYGQALKLIMLAAGYPVPVQTGTHWASGYLAVAKAEGLVNVALTESYLDRAIDRNTIAQIAAKAMKLPASTLTTSPFADVVVGSTYASYIFSLYDAGIITGSVDSKTGATVYYGVNAIKRNEMSVIVWRINNYKKA